MSVGGIESIGGFTPMTAPRLDALDATGATGVTGSTGAVGSTSGTTGPSAEFGHLVSDGLDRLSAVQGRSDDLAVRAATGDLGAIHQYTVAATEAQVTTQLTVAVRNKALEAFNEIMRMPV